MFNANLAQDVWKDPGKNVSFIVLALNHQDLADEQEHIATFADMSQSIIRSMRIRNPESGLQVAIGFSNKAWDYLFPNAKKPKELETYQTLTGAEYSMPASDGDIFLHIRASEEAVVYEIVRQFMKLLSPVTTVLDETKGFRYLEGRAIIGFIDGTEAPAIEDAADYAIIGDEDPDFENGSYAFAQKWQHDMAFWEKLSVEHQEKAVGRHKFDDMELDDEDKLENAHNVASKLEIDGEEQKIIRMNVPFSDPALDYTGTYFIGYARHWQVTKQMLVQMLEKSDFLLTFSTLLSGQLFFIPSRDTLADIADGNFFD
ncbi:Dyp-type peroxidase [Weissella paramesenteroides]|uniref:Dyp-type peroxidase family protein n=1 Tax=Weissella paramesenteroides ATCC 33313 TaxID=585506 RepID=C5RC24_WEIPA|nr:Dyp-type peroxidase [Weissella paramesenteroides]ATF41280.1 peroxidase [Weissella paramesenteroides]EER74241.1 Dyp-type peroxidase family protein [Weissella paramesenteroides ATCC 33313]KAA8446670.1 Dyp-type peroxidase [Weissella paramesenteroides]KAA8454436.1 Dyp-type peroxidase [Weissella paramesenteroides]MCM6765502.1 Dyp-type peroxidase [Weissella paramesenteroides]